MISITELILVIGFFGACCSEASDHNVEIIGGHQISIDKVPYMASLRVSGKYSYHSCGGSIIHEQFILTAAHCIIPYKTYKVLVGTDRADDRGSSGDLYDIEKIIIHQKYSNKTYEYDVCLIKLKQPLNLGRNVAIIQLADKSVKLQNTMVDVTGWGSTGAGVPYSADLQQVSIPVIKAATCQKLYQKSGYNITRGMVCAGNLGKDSCRGDSGGPLTLGSVQVGVTSFGYLKCGDLPGVYTKVSAMKKWIDNHISVNP